MKKIVILATGGTIASRFSEEHGAVVASVGGDQLLGSLGSMPDGVTAVTEQFVNIGSFRITFEIAFGIVSRAGELLADPAISGVVVTCGTDTMEEIAYLADLLIASDKPLVFTGAQRHSGEPDSDGPRNLRAAILVAASETARGLGVTIVFEDEIHGARDVTKTHTSRSGTFMSLEHGKLGEIDDGRAIVTRRPIRPPAIQASSVEPHIDLIKLGIGADGRFVDCAVISGARGIVLEAFGRGNGTPDVVAAVRRAVEAGVVVVVTSRCPQGRVAPIYGGAGGGGHDLLETGAIFAGDLSGIKARVLLAVLLAVGGNRAAIAQQIALHGN